MGLGEGELSRSECMLCVCVCVCACVYSLCAFSLLNYLSPGKVSEATAAEGWVTCYWDVVMG